MANKTKIIQAFNKTAKYLDDFSSDEIGVLINMKFGLEGYYYRKDVEKMIKDLDEIEKNFRIVRENLQ